MQLSHRLFTVYEEMQEGIIDAGWLVKQVWWQWERLRSPAQRCEPV